MPGTYPDMRLWVEAWPSGGYVVRADGSPTPLSRHDTEEEAEEYRARYARGLARAADEGGSPAGDPPPIVAPE